MKRKKSIVAWTFLIACIFFLVAGIFFLNLGGEPLYQYFAFGLSALSVVVAILNVRFAPANSQPNPIDTPETGSQDYLPKEEIQESFLSFSNDSKSVRVGDITRFGNYYWRVLHTCQDRALLITVHIVRKYPYDEEYGTNIWENSTLRQYLNRTFIEEAFSAKEKEQIVASNIGYKEHDIRGLSPLQIKANLKTDDKIFLLSIDEAKAYFKNDADRIAKYNDIASYWWLRSSASYNRRAAYIDTSGLINTDSSGYSPNLTAKYGLRPALLLSLKP